MLDKTKKTSSPHRYAMLALGIVVAISTRTFGQDSSPSPAEFKFGDGSVVRMTLLQEHFDVQTKYGKLTIPVSDVHRIEFGLHIPADVDLQVRQSIKRLASDIYKERDSATRDLVRVGHFAYPSLQKASHSPDQEVSTRAVNAIRQISEAIPPELLNMRADDVIHTTGEFTIIGRINTETIKVRWAHAGELSLKLSDLRTLHLRHAAGKYELLMDAAKLGGSATPWLDTGIDVDAGQRVVISSDGQVDLWPQGPGQYVASPRGYNATGKGSQFLAGALIGRIGENGKGFLVGDNYEGAASEDGKLYLQIVPSPWNNQSTGHYRVRIQTASVSR